MDMTTAPGSQTFISRDFRWHLACEMGRAVKLLARLLERQRGRGRTADSDALRGLVIEPGEAEGMLVELAGRWTPASPGNARRDPENSPQLDERALSAEAHGAFLPLLHAVRTFDLVAPEYDALLLALAVELDPCFGRLVAYLNDNINQFRPTLGLILSAARPAGGDLPSPSMLRRPVLRDGLLEIEGDGPIPALTVRLPADLLQRFTSGTQIGPDAPAILHEPDLDHLRRLVLAEPVRQAAANWAAALRQGRRAVPRLVISGASGTGRTALAAASAGFAGRRLLELPTGASDGLGARLRAARRDARWYRAGVLFTEARADMDWRLFWSQLKDFEGPVMVEAEPDAIDLITSAADTEPLVIECRANRDLQAELWTSLLPPGRQMGPEEIAALATAYCFPPGQMQRAIWRAAGPAGEGGPLTAASLREACRTIGSAGMGRLAQKMPVPYRMQDLVVPDAVRMELELALAWVRNYWTVMSTWGFARRVVLGRGLTALFSGPPGTGKTMAAQILAGELQQDLFRVNLSQVVSKYIGETEKNLARLFDDASASGAILFFDEADALFGKRTEVKDAHDRYANVEIGYLLQRMEEHEGVTILATNRKSDMDEAFVRRFHFMINFTLPSEADRLLIWQGMFPAAAERSPDLDLRPLARHFEISGGEIRNIVLAAAFLAAAAKTPIGVPQIRRALQRELVKNGRVVDMRALDKIGAESSGSVDK